MICLHYRADGVLKQTTLQHIPNSTSWAYPKPPVTVTTKSQKIVAVTEVVAGPQDQLDLKLLLTTT